MADLTLTPPGSIPAGAGEPDLGKDGQGEDRVYPRGCGGTRTDNFAAVRNEGLSPRVRGNLCPRWTGLPATGSIPAGAGEPPHGQTRQTNPRVYPRGCGGTLGHHDAHRASWGLSPRVRGNLPGPSDQSGRPGSIPAGAGEPPAPSASPSLPGVYPRGCGGTHIGVNRIAVNQGLSPRVRGNHVIWVCAYHQHGSIPAGAGEPQHPRTDDAAGGVYPRGCGGTVVSIGNAGPPSGLSPRVRGNPSCV